MTGDGIFHIEGDELVSMKVTPYDAEDVLQELLEKHPDLLAGGQMTPHEPRRWALVKREQGVPDREGSTTRWSIDHLFVDQDAVPTLVEVKRSSDTRIRREVVGQMLDYAANGVRYWPIGDLQLAFEQTQVRLGHIPMEVVASLSPDRLETVEGFFARVGDNLRAGRIRMVFVADVIPDELRRITEFLNEQMSPADVFAVEVKQYKAPGHSGSVIVPAVYGRTAAASVKPSQRGTVDRTALVAEASESTISVLDRLEQLGSSHGLTAHETPAATLLKSGSGQTIATVYLGFNTLDIPLEPLRVRGFVAEADAALEDLQSMTTKKLTTKNPSVPTTDVLAHWPLAEHVIGKVTELYQQSS